MKLKRKKGDHCTFYVLVFWNFDFFPNFSHLAVLFLSSTNINQHIFLVFTMYLRGCIYTSESLNDIQTARSNGVICIVLEIFVRTLTVVGISEFDAIRCGFQLNGQNKNKTGALVEKDNIVPSYKLSNTILGYCLLCF